MNIYDYTGILPEQYTGKEIVASHQCLCASTKDAEQLYKKSKQKLLAVDEWHKLMGSISASFCVTDESGNSTGKPVEKGNYLRVDIPGPGSSFGGGYDWVIVEALEEVNQENLQSIAFRVRPSANPKKENKSVAHFYDPEATSTFIITRKVEMVYCIIADRNIIPNQNTHSMVDTIRNLPVALGAIGLLSKLQWQHLANSLISNHE